MSERLQWKFDLINGLGAPALAGGAALAALAKMMAATTGALDRLNAKMDGLSPHLEKPKKKVGALKTEIGSLGVLGGSLNLDALLAGGAGAAASFGLLSALGAVKGALGGVIDLAKEAARTLYDIGREAIGAASKSERLNLAFDLQLGQKDAGQLRAYFAAITSGKGRIAFGGDALMQAAAPLLLVGARGKELQRAVAAAGDVEALVGGGIGRVERVFGQLAKIRTTGRIEGEAFEAFGVSISDMAKVLKTSDKGARDLLSSGALKPEQLINAIYSALASKTGKGLGYAATLAADTVDAKLAKLQSLPEKYLKAIATSPSYAGFSSFLDQLLVMLNPASPTGQQILAGIQTLAGKILDLFKGITPDTVYRTVTTLVRLGEFAIAAVPSLEKLGNAIGTIVDLMERYVRLSMQLGEKAGLAAEVGAMFGGTKASGASDLGDLSNRAATAVGRELQRQQLIRPGGTVRSMIGTQSIIINVPAGTPAEQAEYMAKEVQKATAGHNATGHVAASLGGD